MTIGHNNKKIQAGAVLICSLMIIASCVISVTASLQKKQDMLQQVLEPLKITSQEITPTEQKTQLRSTEDSTLPSSWNGELITPQPFVPGEVLVKTFLGDTPASLKKTLQKANVMMKGSFSLPSIRTTTSVFSLASSNKNEELKHEQGLERWMKITFEDDSIDVMQIVGQLIQTRLFDQVQPNYVMTTSLIPNDPYYSSSGSWGQDYPDMWGLHLIDADRAWDINTGSQDVVVAVVDTGVDYNHPDIHDNMWINTDEIPNNGIDDDNDGLIDNIYGADFAPDCGCGGGSCPLPDGDPMDEFGHGTHCAGIIAAVGNNGIGVVGVNWNCSIMAVKGLDSTGSGTDEELATALMWAADQGADVISNSWGKGLRISSDPVLEDAVHYADNRGCVVVFAAGNSHDDIQYHSPQNMDEVITVAAVDVNDQQAFFSNWGDGVTVCAPGVDILSLRANGTDMYGGGTHIVGGYYYYASGTSMACPHVAGLAALLLAQDPNRTSEMIKTILRDTGDQVKSRRPIGPRIDAGDALLGVKAATVWLDLRQWADMKGIVNITGTASGVLFESYLLEYGEGYNPVTWTVLASSTTSVDTGILASFDVSGLDEGTYTLRLQVTYGGCHTKTMTHLIIVNNEKNQYIVDDDGGSDVDFTCIQDAVMVSGKDDIISVRPGVYGEQVTVDRPVNLLGENLETTIIDGLSTAHIIVYVATDEVTIQGFTLRNTGPNHTMSRFDSGIAIYGDMNTISGNRFSNVSVGLALFETALTNISDNQVQTRMSGCEIFLSVVSESIVQENLINNGSIGILAAQGGNDNTIEKNDLNGDGSGGSTGIYLYSGFFNTTMRENTITTYDCGVGLAFFSKNNLIMQNTITENKYGFIITDSDNNTITENIIAKSSQCGIFLINFYGYFVSNYNLIYHNDFIFNGINAYDPNTNTWDNGYPSGGNFWSDYQGVDNYSGPGQNITGPDGIGDTRYSIPPGGGNKDRYPLMTTMTNEMFVYTDGPYYHLVGEEIQFSGLACGGTKPYSWYWEFGDGINSTDQTPTHHYDIAKVYNVTLTVTDAMGTIRTDRTTATIYEQLIVHTNGPYHKMVNIPIQFISSVAGGVPPYVYLWYFGDGDFSNEQNPYRPYNRPGVFTVTLTVYDSIDNSVSNITNATINAAEIIANAHGPYIGITGQPVNFTGSVIGGCPPYNWSWDFGDNNHSYEQNPSHIYQDRGIYTVILTVTDPYGQMDNDTTTAMIGLDAEAYGPYFGFAGEPVHFSGSVTGGVPPFTWFWEFGDNTNATIQNPTHTYTLAGNYTAVLTVKDSRNISASDTAQVSIFSHHSSVVWVDDDFNASTPGWGFDHFSTIASGIGAVAPQGTVTVFSGIYYEHLSIEKPLSLLGEDKTTTIIDGGSPQNCPVVDIYAGGVHLSGFTIRHCYNKQPMTSPVSAIYIGGADSVVVTGNIVTENHCGIIINGASHNMVFENDIINNSWIGVSITYISGPPPGSRQFSEDNHVYHNNFINNAIHAYDGFTNFWDNGYPIGGNYWDDYAGVDNNHGPNQDQPGSDGIGDTAYTISNGNNYDRYPLMSSSPSLYAFSTGPYKGAIGESIQFEGYACGGSPPYSWHWLFGDGTNSTDQNPIHNYSATGTYTVTLTVIDNVLSSDNDTTTATIKIIHAIPGGPYSGYTGDPIHFSGNVNGGIMPYTWHWDFGDGNISDLQNATNTYNRADTYAVTFTVTDHNGNNDSETINVTVLPGRVYNQEKNKHYWAIQEAINDADPGNTLLVNNGIYYENIIINKTLTLIGENKYSTIIDCRGSGTAVSLSANGIKISGFTLGNCTEDGGISVSSVSESSIIGNIITNTYTGISLYYSERNIIKGNSLGNNCVIGLYLWGASNNTIMDNEVTDTSSIGIYLFESERNAILRNMVTGNADTGISLDNSNNNTIVENMIASNGFGVALSLASSNVFYHNNFLNNNYENAHCYCSYANIWNKSYPTGGNYWDTYDEPSEGAWDNNSDGFIDTPYIIYEGYAQDNYPLRHRFVRGDLNGDGVVNFGDINPFVQALCGPALYQTTYQMLPSLHGDINQDGELNFGDINPFVALLCGNGT